MTTYDNRLDVKQAEELIISSAAGTALCDGWHYQVCAGELYAFRISHPNPTVFRAEGGVWVIHSPSPRNHRPMPHEIRDRGEQLTAAYYERHKHVPEAPKLPFSRASVGRISHWSGEALKGLLGRSYTKHVRDESKADLAKQCFDIAEAMEREYARRYIAD